VTRVDFTSLARSASNILVSVTDTGVSLSVLNTGCDGRHQRGLPAGFGAYSAILPARASGLRSLRDLLVKGYGLDLTGWTLRSATGISADGRSIVGFGIDPSGDDRACSPSSPKAGLLVALGLAGVALLHRRIV